MRNLFNVLPDIEKPRGQGALALMTGAEVTRVATNNESGIVEIHLDYDGSFGTSDTEEIEALIKKQYFSEDNVSVKLYIHQKEADDPIAAFMAQIEEQNKRAAAAPASAPSSNAYNGKYRKKLEPKLDESEGYGRNFSGEQLKISDITTEMGACIVGGDVVMSDSRVLKNEKTLFEFVITDYSDSIKVKIFCEKNEVKKLGALLCVGQGLLINGEAIYDSYSHEIVIQHIKGIKKTEPFQQRYRDDNEEEKRVELHCHTNMSDMDGVTDVEDLVKAAAHMGHRAIAITDHGVVYAFPHAMSAAKACKKNGQPIKILYGCEGYLVNTPKGAPDKEVFDAPYYHIILLAKNETGRVNLYRMVSESHLNYFSRRPRLPRWLIEECREGIIIGSACERGELFRGVVNELSDEELIDIASFYDYCEIQPVGNNAFMLREPDSRFKTEDDLRDINRKIVEIADKAGKPVAATCDVHFLNPEDEIYRRIINYGMNYPDADIQPPLYLHTTAEMLEEFSYLGDERARNVVIEVPNQIADMCDEISPVRPDKCPPKIEGSDEELRAICTRKAHEIYGEVLPPEVEARLERELNSIISNGYAVMYIFAQRLVKKSNEDGYIVGSRGSVGSSFAATMADITEVNPLPPHYLCPACKYVDFNSPEVRAYAGKAGAIMPDKKCPKCGTQLSKLGFDIPFETFMGFHGDKEPDIDLNFSGEYQAKAHAYTDEMFGHGYTFKAGTISALSDKTAYGFTKKYFEEHNEIKRNCEIDRIALGCNGVRRSTGQHPGGIVVMPRGENIYTFTPIQHPANDVKTDIITTHFD
ncbi:MAG: PHP domain-containing protein, partial [Lachnospiraceae bacterium]|nr:PHP domain-containing protein [Candidatus Minthocola equi]